MIKLNIVIINGLFTCSNYRWEKVIDVIFLINQKKKTFQKENQMFI